MIKIRGLCIITGIFLQLTSNGQATQSTTRIDENLSLIFPGDIKHFDTLGVSLFQSVQNKITYQVVRKTEVIDNATKPAWKEAVNQATDVYMGGVRFESFSKQAKDTVIGHTMGKFIQMKGFDHGQTMLLFIFVTLANRDMYSVQVTSFADSTFTRQSLQKFYAHLQFKGISY